MLLNSQKQLFIAQNILILHHTFKLMKTKKVINILAVVFLLATLAPISSCSKYEEGPSISFRTKKARITNEWELEEFRVNGENFTSLIDMNGDFILDIKSDNTYVQTYDGEADRGKWEFSSNNEELKLISNDGNDTQTWTIVRLANDELWVKFTEDGENYELKFESTK